MEHMELLSENGNHGVVNYLPHYGVTREESTTTKIRVVFDTSRKTSSSQSLNDLLMVGPKIQQELMEILIRFRQHNYVLIANISKMFRQIKINKRDRALQRILWRDDPRDTILKFELTTITYGTASAPYLAQRCLKQLALDNSQTYPGAAATIQNDFYMDDLITGSDSVSHLQQLKQEVVKILATVGLELRKWNSNVLELLSNSENERPLASKEEVKTLGIHWNAQEDMFKFKVTIPREVWPVIVKAKLFMRSLWKLSVNWDDKLPSEFMLEWNSYKERLEVMEEIQVPRQVVIKNAIKVEMHGFCDASQVAYGACIYLCSIDTTEKRTVRLLTSKSRIAPMKIISIPRLELCSAVLLANLTNKIRSVMTFPISKYVYWSDSSIVIHWIRGEPNNYKVFVANRMVEIQGLTRQEEWLHVGTKSNPADMLSRGMDPRELPYSEIWWSGPSWLQASPDQWSQEFIMERQDGLEERSRERVLVTIHEEGCNLLDKFSSLSKLRRVVAYCYRFVENAGKSTQRSSGPLKVEELRRANIALIKIVQRQAYSQEIKELSKEGNFKSVARSSRIIALNPFLDEQGILRVAAV
ncbi:PREDICTED: uncharacterized protein LOC108764898 [Trachymyrmex cornetzi]|uniref:uncharacterized protein LOC108764898 n=1 Tax=Trachymyrmex cornetzi TaxID=471704 RepID=UPI00084F79AD|nr:PREDICTED: uncharacterized protein LOC108764898 [Trachymyrmex cornetzi]